jgi:hypothetical protein
VREIIGLVVGLYLTVALVVGGAGAYAFSTHTTRPVYDCPAIDAAIAAGQGGNHKGSPDWMPWVALRAVAWPYRYWVEQKDARDIPAWLMVQYDAFPGSCR